MKRYPKKIFFIFCLAFMAVFCFGAMAETPVNVLILPFDIHSEKDLSFLQSGIFNMLTTRLAQEGKVVPISREKTLEAVESLSGPVNEKTALSLAESLQADFVLFGSVTVFGESISTDARFMDVQKASPVVVFNQMGKSQGDVIQHIDAFAGQINEKAFGRTAAALAPSAQQAPKDDIYRHPDAVWAESQGIAEREYSPLGEAKVSFDVWRSRTFDTKILGVAVGDVDGDKNKEVVIIGENHITVHRHLDSKFAMVAEIEGSRFDRYLNVDVGDINANGTAEIFITNYTGKNQMSSFVLEWNGTAFTRIVEDANWYFRVIHIPGRGQVLFGQERKSELEIFKPGVYEMKWEAGRYVPVEQQALPGNISVYGFAYGDVMDGGGEMTVAYTYDDRIRIMHANGEEEWTGSEKYGENAIYLEYFNKIDPTVATPKKKGDLDRSYLKDLYRYYLPQRILIDDLDRDGKNEILLVKNKQATGDLLERVKIFTNGHIECLGWNNLGLVTKWRTQQISEYVSDQFIGDLNNDGREELVFSVVSKTSAILNKSKSYIVSWSLKQSS